MTIVASMEQIYAELMGMHEIRLRLGNLSRQRTYQLVSRPDFPKPIASLSQGKVWRAVDVEQWMNAREAADDVSAPFG